MSITDNTGANRLESPAAQYIEHASTIAESSDFTKQPSCAQQIRYASSGCEKVMIDMDDRCLEFERTTGHASTTTTT